MQIAILTPTFNYHSGIDRVVELQAEDYAKKGNEVTVIALESKIKPKQRKSQSDFRGFENQKFSNNYRVIELGIPKNLFLQRLYRLFFFMDFKKLNYYKKLKKFDIVISHFYPMNWLAYLAKKHYKIKYIYHDHGINTTGLINSISQKIYMRLFLFFNNLTLKNVDAAFSVSKYLKNQLKKESKIESKVLYNKIDKKRFNKNIKGDKIIKKYSLKNKQVLLYVGRLAPHKGIHLLLKSFSIVKKQIPNSKLIIVGKPTFNNYFKTLRNSVGISGAQKISKKFSWELKKVADKDVIFTGFVEDGDLPHYYAACNVYTTASLWEGFNLPAAEAQACGKPVVAYNIGSHPEIVKKGILVKEKDINGFADAVIKILKQN